MNKGITTAILAVVILAVTNHGQSVELLPQSRSRLTPTDSSDANHWFHAGPSWESLASTTKDSFMIASESTANQWNPHRLASWLNSSAWLVSREKRSSLAATTIPAPPSQQYSTAAAMPGRSIGATDPDIPASVNVSTIVQLRRSASAAMVATWASRPSPESACSSE